METTPTVWSSPMLKMFRDICIYGFEVPCALIGKKSSIKYSQTAFEQIVDYQGFIPREHLEYVPVEICLVDAVEEYPSHLGYLRISNRPELKISDDMPPLHPASAVIYCALKKGIKLFDELDKAVIESRLFNLQTELKFRLDTSLFKNIEVDEILDKKLPIEEVVVYPGSIACGDLWLEQRKAHSSVRPQQRTPLKTKVSYIWSAIIDIVWLILALRLFTLMPTKTEVILLAVLILLFVQVRFSQIGAFEVFLKGQQQFRHLLKLLRDPLLQDQYTQAELEMEANELSKNKNNMYINLGFLSILFFIALWKLVNAIFMFI
jgi:hypothetical protein